MSNLISSANFIGDISLPNVAGTNPDATKLTQFIAKHEPLFLKELMGIELYELFIAGIAAQTAKYESLRDGGTFTDLDGIVRRFEGLKGVGLSPIANYVYYKYMKYNASQTMGVGESMAAVENGSRAVPIPKMVEAWNQMVDWCKMFDKYVKVYEDDYPEYKGFNEGQKHNELFEHINLFGI